VAHTALRVHSRSNASKVQNAELTPRDLQRVIRDLVSLATIPSSWLGRDLSRIAESAVSLILHTLRVDAAHVYLLDSHGHCFTAERASHHNGFARQVATLRNYADLGNAPQFETLAIEGWPSPLRVVTQPISFSGEAGFVAAGGSSPAFPSETDRLLLSVMANQLNLALQAACLLEERKASEQEARESEERFRAILDTTPECVKLVARDGTLHQMNSAGLTLIGAESPATVVGRNIYDIIAPEDRERFRAFNEQVCNGERGTLEFEIVDCKGQRRKVETHAAPFRAQDGSILHLGTTRDVTERSRAEQLLRESEQRFRVITDAAPIMVWMSGTDKLCYYFNKSWLDFVGRTLEQEAGNGWAENVHRDDFDRCLQIYVTNFDERRPFEMEYRLKHHSGQYRWIIDHGVPRYSANGTFEGYVGGCLDIHDQKEASAVRHRLAAIVESSDDAIISKDLRGIITSWNRGAEKIFGYTAEEMIGSSILKIIPPELQHDEDRILQTIAGGERIHHFETVRVAKDGRRLDVSLTISPVRDDAGKIIGAAKIARDISQQKDAELALRTTERLAAVGRLAATVAHEINNPLEAVTNLVYLAKSVAVRHDVQEYLRTAEEELERVAQLTKQTLGFYRETKGVTTVHVGGTVESFISVFAPRARNKGISIQTEITNDAPIQAVPGEIRQLIGNLVNNSIDAVDTNGKIMIRVASVRHRGESGIRLTVCDNGVGIAKELRGRIFEPFFTTKRDVGTGLGLWVCKSIVEKHHGSIRLKSSTVAGKSGTVFSVFLPAQGVVSKEGTLKQAV
jgi:PAS domain S-box-containing protein